MLLIEFTAVWRNNWTREEQLQNRIVHGDDELKWPEKREEDSVVIDMHELDSFNRSGLKGFTRVITKTGSGYLLKMNYRKFRALADYISTIYTPDEYLLSCGNDKGLDNEAPETTEKS